MTQEFEIEDGDEGMIIIHLHSPSNHSSRGENVI